MPLSLSYLLTDTGSSTSGKLQGDCNGVADAVPGSKPSSNTSTLISRSAASQRASKPGDGRRAESALSENVSEPPEIAEDMPDETPDYVGNALEGLSDNEDTQRREKERAILSPPKGKRRVTGSVS
jgi:hypothetical protein